MEKDIKEELKRKLIELFQFESQDLDFGIYRIMNYKSKEIEKIYQNGEEVLLYWANKDQVNFQCISAKYVFTNSYIGVEYEKTMVYFYNS